MTPAVLATEDRSAAASTPTDQRTTPLSPFLNEAYLDFTQPQVREAMMAGIRCVEEQTARHHPSIIDGEAVSSSDEFASRNPANLDQVIGWHSNATPAMVERAIAAAQSHLPAWTAVPAQQRAELLVRVAHVLRSRRHELCAWLTLEVGKNWAEADAEFAEAVDFLEFYAASALQLDRATTPIQFPGERNQLVHLPLGVVAVIPPWNFPLAILAGMTAAAIVCGNTVVLKPSPEAPTIASVLLRIFTDCGLPAGVINLVQGGAETGAALTGHAGIHAIAFTGSKAVGLRIHEQAAKVKENQFWIKRTILELGGKDAIIVLDDADLDLAAAGVAASAFGFSGQKCSACSIAIVQRGAHDAFVAKLLAIVRNLDTNQPRRNGAVAPLINREAFNRVLRYIEAGKKEGRLLIGGGPLHEGQRGYFVEPTIFDQVPATASIARDEIFGPVLAIVLADDLDEALRIANASSYGLTGALYSSTPASLDRARKDFHVGNLYLNRKCTGAMVGAHPFGGFKLSGTDSKAGGADYLLHFTQAKSIAQRLGV
jgi:1-pyrroline-5-carboxylate dehydrogenase